MDLRRYWLPNNILTGLRSCVSAGKDCWSSLETCVWDYWCLALKAMDQKRHRLVSQLHFCAKQHLSVGIRIIPYSLLPMYCCQQSELAFDRHLVLVYLNLWKQDPKPVDTDQPSASDAVNNFLDGEKNRNKYSSPTVMNCLGSRLHKYWFKAQTGKENVLITAALVSQNCRLKLNATTIQEINELLAAFRPHPLLHRVLEVSYDRDFQHVVIIQEYITEGSLKDMIYKKADAAADWSEKYRRRSKGLQNKTVMLYGRQILEAMLYLYEQGFPYHQLGHVQTGNVFINVTNNTCRLGGHENTLLGYKTRLFRLCRHYEDRIDIVMFGHLLFEMCCGYELTTCSPRKQEYKSVKDKELKATLRYIFEEGFPHSIEEISQKECFKDQQIPSIPKDSVLSQKCQSLLEQLKASSPQQQDPARPMRKKPPSIVESRSS